MGIALVVFCFLFTIFSGELSYFNYSALDAYVLPTRYEGIATSIIEAEINGLRVYSSQEGRK